MEVTRMEINEIIESEVAIPVVTDEALKKEYKYIVASQFLKDMLSEDTISEEEHRKLQHAFAEKYCPIMAGILPETT